MNTYGKSSGHSGNYSTNYQLTGRELLTPDEVRLLDNREAILFIRGERPIKDLKYDILKHPNVKLSLDGNEKPYMYGEDSKSIATINLDFSSVKRIESIDEEETILEDYDLVSSEEIDNYLIKKEGSKNEN